MKKKRGRPSLGTVSQLTIHLTKGQRRRVLADAKKLGISEGAVVRLKLDEAYAA